MKIWDKNKNSIPSLSAALGIKKGSVVQIAGSGGKTTLTYSLAAENPSLKTAILTTTKRSAPKDNAYILNENETIDISKIKSTVVEIGVLDDKGKIGWIGDANYSLIKNWADLILIEADGSKRLPLKAAADYEPVFLPDATHTLVICGMSALGKPMVDVCHRFSLIKDMFSPETIVTEKEINWLLNTFYKLRFNELNPVFIANQADNDALLESGTLILSNLNGYITKML